MFSGSPVRVAVPATIRILGRVNVSDLAFPVVVLGPGKAVSMPVDAEELTTCLPLELRRLPGTTILDLRALKFVVTAARKAKTKKPWWRPPLFFSIIQSQLFVKQVGALSIDEFKKALVNALNRSGWAADNADLIPRVKAATSLSEIRKIFSPEVCSLPRWYEFNPKRG